MPAMKRRRTYARPTRMRRLERRVNKIYSTVNTKHSRYSPVGNSNNITGNSIKTEAVAYLGALRDIKIKYLTVRGYCSDWCDVYIVSKPTTTAPLVTDFNTSIGAFLKDASYEAGYRVWHHRTVKPPGDGGSFTLQKRFPLGIKIPVSDIGVLEGQSLWICVVNRTATTVTSNLNYEIYYTLGTT